MFIYAPVSCPPRATPVVSSFGLTKAMAVTRKGRHYVGDTERRVPFRCHFYIFSFYIFTERSALRAHIHSSLPEFQHPFKGFLDAVPRILDISNRLRLEGVNGHKLLLYSLALVFLWTYMLGLQLFAPSFGTNAEAINIWQSTRQQTAVAVLERHSMIPWCW